MPLDQITLSALQMGSEGIKSAVRDIQITRTLQGANEQVQQIRDSELDDAQKRNELQNLSQQAVFSLAQVGATPDSVKQIAQTISPAVRQPQTIQEALVSPDSATRQRGSAAQKQITDASLAELQAKSGLAQSSGFNKIMRKELDTFRSKNIKDEADALSKVDQIEIALSTKSNTGFEVAKRLLIRLSGDPKPSDNDVRAINPNPDFIGAALRVLKRTSIGEPTDADLAELRTVAQGLKVGISDAVRTKARSFSKRARVIEGVDESEFEKLLLDTSLPEEATRTETRVNKATGEKIRVTIQGDKVISAERIDG